MKKTIFIGKVFGESMRPLINPGDSLFIYKKGKMDIKLGDLVVFYDKGKIICHRVVAKKNNRIVAKGDNLPFVDKPIKISEVLGKVAKVDGMYGSINFESRKTHLLQYYFIFCSLAIYYMPKHIASILLSLVRGKRFITKLSVGKTI